MFESTDIVLRHLISLAYARQLDVLLAKLDAACGSSPRWRSLIVNQAFLCLNVIFSNLFGNPNLKSIICFHIPLNPSVRRVRRVYTLILNFTFNYAMHFSKKTINPTCQCFLLVTFLSRKKSNKTHPSRPPRPYASRASIM